ncbi:MAG: hypothetical protein ACRDYA_07970 [Egibacteraceae bacterium]
MPLTVRAHLAALLVGGVVCAGCQGGVTTTAEPLASQPAPAEAASQPPSTATRVEPASPRTGLPGSLKLSLEQGTKDGVKVEVTRITFEPEQILVDLVATNASSDPVTLAGSPFTGMTLVDDKGTSYNFQAPKRNRALRVAPGQTYEGQVSFLGALADDASSLTLTTNAGAGGDRFVPRFEFANIAVAPS